MQIVRGMQEGTDAHNYVKVTAALKHFTLYNAETNRFFQNYNVTAFDLWDSYLPAFAMGFKIGGALGAMCRYVVSSRIHPLFFATRLFFYTRLNTASHHLLVCHLCVCHLVAIRL